MMACALSHHHLYIHALHHRRYCRRRCYWHKSSLRQSPNLSLHLRAIPESQESKLSTREVPDLPSHSTSSEAVVIHELGSDILSIALPADPITSLVDTAFVGRLEQSLIDEETFDSSQLDQDGRSGRTLWNVLADIVQFGWGQPAESYKSPVKSGGRSSSCPSSETSFSGYDARSAVDSAPSSSSGGISAKADFEVNVDELTSEVTTSMDWSQLAAGLFRGSPSGSLATLEVREGGKEAIASDRVDQIKDALDFTPTEFSVSKEHEVELEQEKILRNKQVMRATFDECEEAYRLETEQRKIDEVFMREALEEARKAADRWEVPVGAVLVRDGRIIARGYNRVEDLRDCTAHAEMICIREASKILQTWRLLETTLYVTLEPCAMCAGAILQARTGTLVYGAPNKHLGADGSWIRLFPSSSVDREGGSDSMAKPEVPVHPFHRKMTIRRGILEAECADVMQQFFRLRRKKDKKTEQADWQQSIKKLLLQPSKLLQKMHHVLQLLFCL